MALAEPPIDCFVEGSGQERAVSLPAIIVVELLSEPRVLVDVAHQNRTHRRDLLVSYRHFRVPFALMSASQQFALAQPTSPCLPQIRSRYQGETGRHGART